ncbi:MAG: hypothetical protein EBZ47_04940, partial [Chlamydiae bacterium]|nr:hypothetical protein [Chlamydiota bacterium]
PIVRLIRAGDISFRQFGILECLYPSNLSEYIQKERPLGSSFEETALVAYQIFQGLSFLSQIGNSIIHGGIKPENILVEFNLETKNIRRIRLADFGISRHGPQNNIQRDCIGTRNWRAPELELRAPFDTRADLWSAACVLYFVYTSKCLFNSQSQQEYLEEIIHFAKEVGPSTHQEIPPAKARKIEIGIKNKSAYIEDLLAAGANQTLLHSKEKLESPVLTVYRQRFSHLLDSLLQWLPENRMLPIQALDHPFFLFNTDVGIKTSTSSLNYTVGDIIESTDKTAERQLSGTKSCPRPRYPKYHLFHPSRPSLLYTPLNPKNEVSAIAVQEFPTSSSTLRLVTRLSVHLKTTYEKIDQDHIQKNKIDLSSTLQLKETYPIKDLSSIKQLNDLPDFFVNSVGKVHILQLIGAGAYGSVYHAYFQPHGSGKVLDVALKVNRVVENDMQTNKLLQSLQNESNILAHITSCDPEDSLPIARYVSQFPFGKSRHCLLQNKYAGDLCSLPRPSNVPGAIFDKVAQIAQSILQALIGLKKDPIGLAHCDLKPENILLDSCSQNHLIRITDFGMAKKVPSGNEKKEYIISRFYRPPEIALYLPFSFPVDMWGAACILYELLLSKPLFPARKNSELFRMFCDFLGPVPEDLIPSNHFIKKYLIPVEDNPKFLQLNPQSDLFATRYSNRKEEFENEFDYLKASLKEEAVEEKIFFFKDFLMKILCWDPTQRLTPEQALEHPFILQSLQKK